MIAPPVAAIECPVEICDWKSIGAGGFGAPKYRLHHARAHLIDLHLHLYRQHGASASDHMDATDKRISHLDTVIEADQ